MSESLSASKVSGEVDRRVAEIVAEITDRLHSGGPVDVEAYLNRYPELADRLRPLLAALDVLAQFSSSGGSGRPSGKAVDGEAMSGTLGDFRIVREVGRGGMGIVYEAEQISLRRRVALKVLPFAATMDPRHLQRFHNEAQAAASLHHTNIVPVYFVGCERSVHFYAMQFIDGQPLSEVIRQLQHMEKKAATEDGESAIASGPAEVAAASTPAPAAELTPLTDNGKRRRDFFHKVAELGIQAAEALDQAHQLGIGHRDIKPGNLMLDVRGKLWVTDFGLAHMQHGESSLTMTGQAVGTPRYMSPEQASAKRVPIDHRTDVYSLGVTLYELLTLRPAFTTEDRQELLRQIAIEEPVPPRRLNRAIAPELETIVLKAMEKDPTNRYATAKGLADDLRCFLEDRPIQARRPSLPQRLRKLARRHRTATMSIAVCLLVSLTVLAGSIGWSVADRAARRRAVEAKAESAFEQAIGLQEQGKYADALSAILRAEGLLDAEGDPELRHRVQERRKDLEMVLKLENLRLENTENHRASDLRYQKAFREFGIDVDVPEPAIAADRIRERSIRTELVLGLDTWAIVRRYMARRKNDGERLLVLAGMVDTDAWRNRFRDAVLRSDTKVFKELATEEAIRTQSSPSLTLLGDLLKVTGSGKEALAFLLRAQRFRPNDLWINCDLASLCRRQTRQLDDALRFAMIAVALRPDNPAPHNSLGAVLLDKAQYEEAFAEFQKAIELAPELAWGHNNLGNALRRKGQLDEAIAKYRKAIELNPEIDGPHYNLAMTLQDKGRVDEAITECQKAIELNPNLALAHNILGNALKDKGRLDEAIVEHRKAIELDPKYALAYFNLGNELLNKGRVDEAIAQYQRAIEADSKYAPAHSNLGNVLMDKGQVDEAIAQYQKAIELDPKLVEAHNNLGNALMDKGRLDEAIAQLRKAIETDPKYALAHNNLGNALKGMGRLDEAIAELKKSIELDPTYAKAYYNLGNTLYEKGQLDAAIAEYQKALQLEPKFALGHNNLGNALKEKGRLDEAIAEYRQAIRLQPNEALAHCNLGQSLMQKGLYRQAVDELRRGHELGSRSPRWSQPSARWVQNAEVLADLDARLPALLEGKEQAKDAGECLTLARICQEPHKKLYAAATRWYREAFAVQPASVPRNRYNAARAAALAGCGQGRDAPDLTEDQRARLRHQALDWLRADLEAFRSLLTKDSEKPRSDIARRLQHWQGDSDFAGVRGSKALDKLPESERTEWQWFWKEVESLRQRATSPPRRRAA